VTHQASGVCKVSSELWHESKREIREEKERERNEFHLVAGDEGANVLFEARRREAKKDEPPQTTFQASINGKRAGDFQVSYSVDDFGFEDEPVPASTRASAKARRTARKTLPQDLQPVPKVLRLRRLGELGIGEVEIQEIR
jgi:hypothetical protein